MELVVHIGTYKTGTTYIQGFMKKQSAAFERHGWYIPAMGRGPHGRPPFHNLAFELIQSPQYREEHGNLAQLEHDLRTRRPEKAVISSEVLATALLSDRHGEASRARFAALADSVGARLRYVMFVRDQAEVMNSAYCQNVKQLVVTKTFEAWAEDRVNYSRLDYLTWVAPLLDDPSVDFDAFNYAEAREAGLLATFLGALGLSPDAVESFEDLDDRANTRPGPAPVAVGRALAVLARSDPTFAWYRPRYKRLSKSLIRHGERLDLNKTGFWGWSEERSATCAEKFRAPNEAFAQRLWNRPWPSQTAIRPKNALTLDEALDHFDQRAKADLFGSVATSVLKNLG